MKKQPIDGFRPFVWGIAVLCLPVLLSPLGILLSTNFAKNPSLSDWQVNTFSLFFWLYPFLLAIIARLLYKLEQHKHALAVQLLVGAILLFWAALIGICTIGFGL
ncbi:hypothetical protein HMPREF9952_0655 [Haemophilus pittmaniae HK 85]|uniref:Uncharacterized protein n=1 Tax=Haemophilus pittmaniae HK 85 TaxID=1035188 RepID=F9Q9F2_9PAST|nr:DUF5389 family protein [Haemophilus pittmaniae]EGV05678.1 hypothetical protein HMPREF9952_0655 [Haemophilus pittmaniae HK 85]SNV65947.1 aspartate-semialdehyde dehydrogenase [Haemophilus pittmaniae]